MSQVATKVYPTETQTDYEPTISDRIQRILYRLDSGEELSYGALSIGNSFCVLGLFADESGLGEWGYSENLESNEYRITGTNITSAVWLCDMLADYYDLRTGGGTFDINCLTEDLRNRLLTKGVEPNYKDFVSLDSINDQMLSKDAPYDYEVNILLADVIRSGVIFKSFGSTAGV